MRFLSPINESKFCKFLNITGLSWRNKVFKKLFKILRISFWHGELYFDKDTFLRSNLRLSK